MQYLQGLILIAMHDFDHYKPVSCDFYDRLINFAGSKSQVDIIAKGTEGAFIKSGIIQDVFTRNKAEFCVIDGCELRLDQIESVLPSTNLP